MISDIFYWAAVQAWNVWVNNKITFLNNNSNVEITVETNKKQLICQVVNEKAALEKVPIKIDVINQQQRDGCSTAS